MCLPSDLASFDSVRFNLSVAGFDFIRVVERLVKQKNKQKSSLLFSFCFEQIINLLFRVILQEKSVY
jgi:hypothetical protein